MNCTLTAEDHALYLPGCRCGADTRGVAEKTYARKTGRWSSSKAQQQNVKLIDKGETFEQLECVAVIVSITDLPTMRPIRTGDRFTTPAGVTFVIKSMRLTKYKNGKRVK